MPSTSRLSKFAILLAIIGTASCNPTEPEPCNGIAAIALNGGSCLVFEDNGVLQAYRGAVEAKVRDAYDAAGHLLPVTGTVFRVAAGTSFVIPEIGFGARTNGTRNVEIQLNPASPNLANALGTELFPLVAHELHHVARFRTAGFNANLVQSMITEGLADQFAVELAGIGPPRWSSALTGATLQTWVDRSRSEWSSTSYNHDAWFFGSTPDIPRWAGYAIGFELARRYIQANPTRRASQLYGEPAASFIQ